MTSVLCGAGCADRHRVGGEPIYGGTAAPPSWVGAYGGYPPAVSAEPPAPAAVQPLTTSGAVPPAPPPPAAPASATGPPETMETSGGPILALPASELPHATPPVLPAGAAPPSYRVPIGPRRLPMDAPAMRFANLSPAQCRAEVERRGLPVAFEAKEVDHVALAVRLTGPMHGVRFVAHPAPSPYGILDCRLALALDEMAMVLARYGFASVRLDSMHRPHAVIAGTKKSSQHSYGLAADIMRLTTDEGDVIPVEGHWDAGIGDTPCGPDAKAATDPKARRMRDVVCAIARAGVFHHMLTPSANAAHRNHYHFDIQRDRSNRFVR